MPVDRAVGSQLEAIKNKLGAVSHELRCLCGMLLNLDRVGLDKERVVNRCWQPDSVFSGNGVENFLDFLMPSGV
ncbi:MAG: hypothetical protein ACI8UO_002987 [Verrucomicrobiales bacterium]|jgi:hypothetical protein